MTTTMMTTCHLNVTTEVGQVEVHVLVVVGEEAEVHVVVIEGEEEEVHVVVVEGEEEEVHVTAVSGNLKVDVLLVEV